METGGMKAPLNVILRYSEGSGRFAAEARAFGVPQDDMLLHPARE
jgi:hypothetical protein